MQLLRLNINDDYNNNMNSVDINDQFHNQYMINHWIQKYRWWREPFWWIHSVLVLNAYVIYNTNRELKIVLPMSHHEL